MPGGLNRGDDKKIKEENRKTSGWNLLLALHGGAGDEPECPPLDPGPRLTPFIILFNE